MVVSHNYVLHKSPDQAKELNVLPRGRTKKMQLDVDMSPPTNIMTFRLGLTNMTFDLDPCDL